MKKVLRALSLILVLTVSLSITAAADAMDFVNAAREAYVTEGYADYTTSLMDSYQSQLVSWNYANVRELTWEAVGDGNYTLYISTSPDFTEETTWVYEGITEESYSAYHLMVDTDYYWKAVSAGEETEVHTMHTPNTVRFTPLDGVFVGTIPNVRDIGGWTGLNQGLAYRGPALENITEEGKNVALNYLKIKTDLDLRGNVTTETPLGESVTLKNVVFGSYANQLVAWDSLGPALETYADYDNYPIYAHCAGGCDRTGTCMFLIEALCGVPEEDLCIDFELSNRRRYNLTGQVYADMISDFKEIEGETFQDKAETLCLERAHLTHNQIYNIRSILAGNMVCFNDTSDLICGKGVTTELLNLEGHTIKSVTQNGRDITYSVSGNTLTMDLYYEGTGEIEFEDGNILEFYAVKDDTEPIPADVLIDKVETKGSVAEGSVTAYVTLTNDTLFDSCPIVMLASSKDNGSGTPIMENIAVKSEELKTEETKIFEVTIPVSEAVSEVKLYIWESAGDMRPLKNAVVIGQ